MTPYNTQQRDVALLTFTLDTNCLLSVAENRPEATAVRTLIEAHAAGRADVALVAMSASERQQGNHYIANFSEFEARLASLGLSHLTILEPMTYFDITFWERSLYSDDNMLALERTIHGILFPNVEFMWADYCLANHLDPSSLPSGRWRNCKCDVQNIWTHIHGCRDVFVTSDQKFHALTKKASFIALGAKAIEYPDDAIALL